MLGFWQEGGQVWSNVELQRSQVPLAVKQPC